MSREAKVENTRPRGKKERGAPLFNTNCPPYLALTPFRALANALSGCPKARYHATGQATKLG